MTVFSLRVGEYATVTKINVTGGARERLASLGVRRGGKVRILGYSMFGSSVLIACGAVRVAVRRSLAEKIEVEI